jgi:hypothetical protein
MSLLNSDLGYQCLYVNLFVSYFTTFEVSRLGLIESLLLNDKLERVWKEVVVA